MKHFELIDTDYISFLIRLSETLQSCKIQPSRVDEEIVHKTQRYEQEVFYNELYTGIDSDSESKDKEIAKTLKYGSLWMK
jgi:hypothetical protein